MAAFLWLSVVGAELSMFAISELFKELGLAPEISKIGKLGSLFAKNIDILVGDIFDVSAEFLGPISVIYDRAALVALLHAYVSNIRYI